MASSPNRRHNQLLAALPEAEWQRWRPHLEPVALALGHVLYESGDRLGDVYLPTTAIVSLLYVMEDDRAGPVLHFVLRYTQVLITQMAQTAVCNRHHSVDQQLCRWLLLSLDRLRGDELVMTQELIANMLGVRRDGVTESALKLQKAGLIRCARGRITVLDRPGLEQATCECYAVVKKEYDRLLPAKLAI